jgi:hypothetical protein
MLLWTGLGLMTSFMVLSFLSTPVRTLIESHRETFPLLLVVLYLLFLVPSRRLYRYQRFGRISLTTNRKGLTYLDQTGEKVLAWRDLEWVRVIADVRRNCAFVTKLILKSRKDKITLEIDPPANQLENVDELLGELEERVDKKTYSMHWFYAVCPFCRTPLRGPAKRGEATPACAGCGRPIEFASKALRPWELIREEGLYLFLLLLVAGRLFIPLAFLYLGLMLLIPLFMSRPSRLVLLGVGRQAATTVTEQGAGGGPGTAVAVMLALWLLAGLGAGPAHAEPAASPSSSASPAVSTSPSAAPVPRPSDSGSPSLLAVPSTYFPLAVGNEWEYHSNLDTILVKVTGKETVNGVDCFVVDSLVGPSRDSAQREDYAVTPQGLEVLKRTHKGSDFFLDVPEPMLTAPVRPGRRWTWQGNAADGNVFLAFDIKPFTTMDVANKKLRVLPVVMQGRSADGSEIQTKRWYAPNVGMVRELTIMKKGMKSIKVDAVLTHYSLQSNGSP